MTPQSQTHTMKRSDAGFIWGSRLAFVTLLIVITDLALSPGFSGHAHLFGPDKIEHLAAFGALTLFVRAGWPGLNAMIAAGFLMIYGIVIELIQGAQMTGRTASLADLAADALGVLAGLALAALFIRLHRS